MYLRSLIVAIISSLLLVGCPAEIAIPIDPPVARKDYAQTPINTPVTLAPLANDHDPDAEALTVIAIGTPSNGTATLNLDYTIDYTPNTGFTGGDSFTVTISDASGNEAIESAYITVGPSLRFLFLSNFEDFFTRQLYLADTAHPGVGMPVNQYLRITDGPNVTESAVETYSPSPDGSHVVLLADDSDESNARNLFVVDLDRLGVVTQVSDFAIGQGTSVAIPPQMTLDNAYVLYLSNEFTSDLFELVMVEVAKPANRVRVNPAMVTGQSLRRFTVTPDGTRVLYVLNNPTTGFNQLLATELTNPGVATVISGTPTATTTGVLEFASTGGVGFDFVPGTTQVVYPATENGATVAELWMVDYVTPAAPVKVSGTGVALGTLSFRITNDGTRVINNNFETLASQLELYMGSLTAPGPSVRLSAPQTGAFSISSYGVGQDSTFVVYLSDLLTADVRELFMVDFATPEVATRLNAPLPADINVLTLALSPAAPRMVLYSNPPDSEKPAEQQIYAVDVDVPGIAVAVGVPILSATTVLPIFAPDGVTVLYGADPDRVGSSAIYAVRLDAPTVIVKQTPERFGGAEATSLRFLP